MGREILIVIAFIIVFVITIRKFGSTGHGIFRIGLVGYTIHMFVFNLVKGNGLVGSLVDTSKLYLIISGAVIVVGCILYTVYHIQEKYIGGNKGESNN